MSYLPTEKQANQANKFYIDYFQQKSEEHNGYYDRCTLLLQKNGEQIVKDLVARFSGVKRQIRKGTSEAIKASKTVEAVTKAVKTEKKVSASKVQLAQQIRENISQVRLEAASKLYNTLEKLREDAKTLPEDVKEELLSNVSEFDKIFLTTTNDQFTPIDYVDAILANRVKAPVTSKKYIKAENLIDNFFVPTAEIELEQLNHKLLNYAIENYGNKELDNEEMLDLIQTITINYENFLVNFAHFFLYDLGAQRYIATENAEQRNQFVKEFEIKPYSEYLNTENAHYAWKM